MASLRLHLRTGKHKRPSIQDITKYSGAYLSDTELSKHIPSNNTIEGSSKHSKNMSVACSFIGSLRGLGRKNTLSSQPRSSFDRQNSDNTSTMAQFPSSPIDIPTTAPALSLDLGPTALMSSGFATTPREKRDAEIEILQDPSNITSARPSVEDFRPAELLGFNALKFPLKARKVPYVTGDIQALPNFDCELEKLSRPSTPMPGTTFQLDLDGYCSRQSDVFERGVESPGLKVPEAIRHLRHMNSLDAMAQACSIAHKHDDEAKEANIRRMRTFDASSEACKVAHQNDDNSNTARRQLEEEQCVFKKANQVPDALTCICEGRVVSETSTTTIIPSDMDELSRQSPHKLILLPRATGIVDENTKLARDHGSGPPSPDRSIDLPLRLKPKAATSLQLSCNKSDSRMTEMASVSEQNSAQSLERTYYRNHASACPVVFRPFQQKAARDLNVLQPELVSSMRPEYSMDAPELTPPTTAPESQSVLANSETIGLREALQISPKPTQMLHPDAYASSPKDTESVLTDYEKFKTQQLFNDNFDFQTTSPAEESSLRTRFIPQLHSRFSSPRSSTPSYRNGLTDVRNAFWRMSVNNWLGQHSDSPVLSENEPASHIAADSSYPETTQTPVSALSIDGQISSMGSRLEFDQRSSIRNARYNALQMNEPLSASSASAPIEFEFDLPDSDEDIEPLDVHGKLSSVDSLKSLPHRRRGDTSDSQDTYLADALIASNAVQENLPETVQHVRRKDISETRESIVSSLKDALLANHMLQAQLDAPESDTAAGFADVSSPGQDCLFASRNFSPVTPRREPWTNRFDIFTQENQESSDSFMLHRRTSAVLIDRLPSQKTPRHHSSNNKRVQDSLHGVSDSFPSPSSGYKAAQNSAEPASASKSKPTPLRYKRGKDGERKALGEVPRNLV